MGDELGAADSAGGGSRGRGGFRGRRGGGRGGGRPPPEGPIDELKLYVGNLSWVYTTLTHTRILSHAHMLTACVFHKRKRAHTHTHTHT